MRKGLYFVLEHKEEIIMKTPEGCHPETRKPNQALVLFIALESHLPCVSLRILSEIYLLNYLFVAMTDCFPGLTQAPF